MGPDCLLHGQQDQDGLRKWFYLGECRSYSTEDLDERRDWREDDRI
jgi:hypothetical protein